MKRHNNVKKIIFITILIILPVITGCAACAFYPAALRTTDDLSGALHYIPWFAGGITLLLVLLLLLIYMYRKNKKTENLLKICMYLRSWEKY